MRNTRAQLKMGESFAVLVVFFILLGIGLIFYNAIQRSSVREQQEESLDKRAIQLAQAAAFLPEIQCSFADVVQENCIDLYKLMAFTQMARIDANYLSYRTLFGNSRIAVRELYPNSRSWEIYDAAQPGQTQYRTKISTFVPVALLDASVRPETYAFGYLNVTLYG